MIGELHILGLYAPAALVSALVGGLLMLAARQVLLRLGLYRWVWHPGLFDLALYLLLWTAAAAGLDHLHPNTLVLSW
jgi:protein-S-isoprenylcysteine O-methyltransferase Ste14